ncbi:F-box domain-containing protein [Achaetomium macrosporum]|uniref:F-box domain-containing protein n=1 Tax=Achaetomium macrosporum TaxID=79813 RepID=A0AAN7CBQ6_9PEZI|nr:F-box domain-containing protein [Achaetomium macrosporum]
MNNYSCTLCGCDVGQVGDEPAGPSWAQEFRGPTPSCKRIPFAFWPPHDFIAPLDRSKRWSDAGYNNPAPGQFGVLMQPWFNDRQGFLFHEACWDLLEQAMHPAPVPLSRLQHVCRSLAVPRISNLPIWGHDYGGAWIIDNAHYFPWDDYRFPVRNSNRALDPAFRSNPYRVPDVERILAEEPEGAPAPRQTAPSRTPAPATHSLTKLPGEPRYEIAAYLPTADVLGARLASRAFWPVFHDQKFWASSFEASASMWVFDPAHLSTQRQVEVIEYLDWAELPRLRSRCVAIPDNLARLSASTVALENEIYIVGLSFTTATGDTIRVGYRSSSEQSVELSQVFVFRLVVGSWGIRALQCITGPTGSESTWLGCPNDACLTDRLVLTTSVRGLEARFDACKMVSLTVHASSQPRTSQLGNNLNLRNSALCYPDVPAPALLNKGKFPPRAFYTTTCNPLFWCSFGGSSGEYLPYLTGVSMVWDNRGLYRMDFAF